MTKNLTVFYSLFFTFLCHLSIKAQEITTDKYVYAKDPIKKGQSQHAIQRIQNSTRNENKGKMRLRRYASDINTMANVSPKETLTTQWNQPKREAIKTRIPSVNTVDFPIKLLIRKLDLTATSQKNWVNSHQEDAQQIIAYLQGNAWQNKSSTKGRVLFCLKRPKEEDAATHSVFSAHQEENLARVHFAKDFLKITDQIENAKFKRYLELNQVIKSNPLIALEHCIQENGLEISNYKFLYRHQLPKSGFIRLNSLGVGFENQPLHTGNAVAANVDYYSVEVIKNPDFNKDGIPDSNTEVYKEYRAKFVHLASGTKKDFQLTCSNDPFFRRAIGWTFSPYDLHDQSIWVSNNPITALIKINTTADAPLGDVISDHGAIMISAYTPDYWIGSSVKTRNTGTQPFSGNRQWGYLLNSKGNLELYTRAVDVARISDFMLVGPSEEACSEDIYYRIADITWLNLQRKIKDWVNSNNGQAIIIPKTAIRFNKSKLKKMLESHTTITQIKCH